MRNKKYRLWKAIIILLFIGIFLFAESFILREKWEKICMYVFSAIIICFTIPIAAFQFFEVQADRIVMRGSNSLNKKYDKSLKKLVFMFEDLEDITVAGNKVIWLHLKNGYNVTVWLGGFLKKQELVSLVYEVRAQIKGYEQYK